VRLAGRGRRIAVISITVALMAAIGASTTVFAGADGGTPAGAGGGESGSGLMAWGFGLSGQLGDGVLEDKSSPVAVQKVTCAVSATVGYQDSYAVLANGHVDAWGEDSAAPGGELGDGGAYYPDSDTPVEVPDVTTAIQVAASIPDVFVVLANGTIDGWGDNRDGPFGTGESTAGSTTPVSGIGKFSGGVSAVATEREAVLALLTNGEVESWGFDENDQLGDGSAQEDTLSPVHVKGIGGSGNLTNVKAIGIGASFGEALTDSGEMVAWGAVSASSGLGAGTAHTSSNVPVTVENVAGTGPLKEVEAIAGGGDHVLALLKDGKVVAWGSDELGQLGNGEHGPPTTYLPVAVKGLTEVVAITATEDSSYALRKNGTVWAWGNNTEGQLGVGSAEPYIDEPVEVSALGDTTSALASGPGAENEIALGPVSQDCNAGESAPSSSTSTSTATSTSSTQTATAIPVTTSTTSSITSTGSGNPNEPNGSGNSSAGNLGRNTAASGGVLATALGLPPAKACFSHRSFAIHVHQPAGYPKILSAEVFLGHKREGTVKGKRIASEVDLRGLPAGTFTILIVAHLQGGQTITGTRTYHTCAKHRLKGHHHRL
jgi:alpha-tubulin suppressor-like RCC1 family protein